MNERIDNIQRLERSIVNDCWNRSASAAIDRVRADRARSLPELPGLLRRRSEAARRRAAAYSPTGRRIWRCRRAEDVRRDRSSSSASAPSGSRCRRVVRSREPVADPFAAAPAQRCSPGPGQRSRGTAGLCVAGSGHRCGDGGGGWSRPSKRGTAAAPCRSSFRTTAGASIWTGSAKPIVARNLTTA